jgi:hypothetical protein
MMNNAMGDLCSLGNLSVDLVNQAEQSCADSDPDDLGDAAGMVLVGDVYGMIVSHEAVEAVPYVEAEKTDDSDERLELKMIDSLNPFIR